MYWTTKVVAKTTARSPHDQNLIPHAKFSPFCMTFIQFKNLLMSLRLGKFQYRDDEQWLYVFRVSVTCAHSIIFAPGDLTIHCKFAFLRHIIRKLVRYYKQMSWEYAQYEMLRTKTVSEVVQRDRSNKQILKTTDICNRQECVTDGWV